MRPTALTLTASRKAPIHAERRRRGTMGLRMATKTNEGAKMAAALMAAPGMPAST